MSSASAANKEEQATKKNRGMSNKQKRASLESGSPLEKLLAQSPSYTENCELYPKAMRETINEFPEGAVLADRDPGVTAAAERGHRASIERQRQRSAANPKEELCFYPGASRAGIK